MMLIDTILDYESKMIINNPKRIKNSEVILK